MTVLLTGGSGAIGSFVAETLLESGQDVVVFDISNPALEGVTFVDGDVTADDALREAATRFDVDVIVHMAALLPSACRDDPQRAQAVNIGGTVAAFEAGLATETRILYTSTKAVFGEISGRHAHPTYDPIGADAPKNPKNNYSVTKLACEGFAQFYRERGLECAGLRFSSTYGPGKGDAHGSLAYLPELIRRAAAGERIRITGADQRNDFIYYGDIARGVAAAIDCETLTYPMYQFGSGTTTSLHEIANILTETTDCDLQVTGGLNFRGDDRPSYCQLDISRAQSDLGYEPAYPVDVAIPDFLERLAE